MISSDHVRTADTSSDAPVGTGEGAAASAEVETLRRALEEEQQRTLRLLADFDNIRRRVAREQEAARYSGRREVRRGWRLGDEVLRPAQVVVATAREVDDPWR